MHDLNQHTITQQVVERFADTPDARLKQLMTSLVTHLHSFAREVHLTEGEWEQDATGRRHARAPRRFRTRTDCGDPMIHHFTKEHFR